MGGKKGDWIEPPEPPLDLPLQVLGLLKVIIENASHHVEC